MTSASYMLVFLDAPTLSIKGRKISPNLEMFAFLLKEKVEGGEKLMGCDLRIFHVVREDFCAHWLSQY